MYIHGIMHTMYVMEHYNECSCMESMIIACVPSQRDWLLGWGLELLGRHPQLLLNLPGPCILLHSYTPHIRNKLNQKYIYARNELDIGPCSS